jgi:ABC-type transport system involved in multi-copper enzyme maturation permease subunit
VIAFARLVRNELEKTWRSRWIVFVVLFGLFALIAGGIYAYYVYQDKRWTPPPPMAWQTQLRDEIRSNQSEIASLQQLKQQQAQGGAVVVGPFGGRFSLDSAIARAQQSINNDNYLLDNNIAPIQSFSITSATLFALGGIIMFLLTRIFGWLASEQIAGERADRTIAILLSRPASRDQVLAAKAVASFLISLVVVLATLLIVFGVFAFLNGSAGPFTGQVGIALDGAQPLGAGNLVVMPIPLVVAMCVGAAMLGVLCVQGVSLLISVVTGRWAAIGITLAVLFGAPLVSTIVSGIVILISGSDSAANFLNYLFFNVLSPVGSIAPPPGSGSAIAGTGINEFVKEITTLAVWTVAFYFSAWFLFHRKQET